MKKSILSILLLLFLTPLFSQNDFRWNGKGQPFELSFQVDIPLLTAGLGLNASTFVYEKWFSTPKTGYTGTPFDISEVNGFDRQFAHGYNKTADKLSDYLMYGILISPVMFMATPSEDWLCIGTMYGETLLLTRGIKETLKLAVRRTRPYMYFDNPPQDDIDKNDWYLSFPSGHTSMVFATAAFSSYLANEYFGDSYWKWAVIGGSFALATADGILRIAAGCHFATDVLTGALLGTSIGLFVPWLHTLTYRENSPVTISPLGFNVNLRF